MYPSQPLTLTWGGQSGSTAEGEDIWQCGLHIGDTESNDTPTLPTAAQLAGLYTTVIAPFHRNAQLYIQRGAILTWAKMVISKTDGKYLTEPITHAGFAQPGNASGENGAPQLSMCVTLWSGESLGKGNYGRFYLPWTGIAAEPATGRLSTTARDYIADTAAQFIRDVNAWVVASIGAPNQVLIFGSTGAGTKKEPKQVRVGDVVDTQRRRRNRISEAYAARVLYP